MIKSEITDNGKPAFHGELKENERVVQLRPGLAASDDDKEGGASECFSVLILCFSLCLFVVHCFSVF